MIMKKVVLMELLMFQVALVVLLFFLIVGCGNVLSRA